MANAAINKYLYKIELIILKYIPIIMAICDVIHTIFSYFMINAYIFDLLTGQSSLTLIFLYTSSYVFKFCYVHRLPLHYIVISNLIALYDSLIGIPISDKIMFCVYLILAGIFVILYVYLNQQYKKKCLN